jgi:flavodoxin
MNTLVVFYSRSGTTKQVAESIAKYLGCDIEEIVDTQKRSGILGLIKSGRQAMQKKMTTLQPLQKDVSSYDLVVIGTPMWAGRISVPVFTFISQNKDKMPDVAFFLTNGGTGNQTKVFSAMEELCGKKPKATLSISHQQFKSKANDELAQAFAKNLET